MNDFLKYLRAQWLRGVKWYPVILAFTAVLAVGLALALGSLFTQKENAADQQKVTVGLVGDLSDSYLGIGVFAVSNFDTSKDYVTLQEMEESKAKEALQQGDITGYVVFPEDFIPSVMRGENLKITYVSSNRPAVLGRLVTEEVVGIVSDLVIQSQNGIYGYIDYLDRSEVPSIDRQELIEQINVEYITQVFDRETLYTTREIGISNRLSYQEYYVAAFLVLMVLLWGTVCAGLLVKSDLSVDRVLLSRGYRISGQVLAEYLPFFGILGVNLLLLLTGVGAILSAGDAEIALLSGIDSIGEYLALGWRLLPAVALVSALQFFLYTLTSHIISGVLLQILSVVALSYASGLLYPLYSLPPTLQQVAVYLPTGVAFQYVSECVTRQWDGGSMAVTVGYAVALLVVSMAVRRGKIRGGRL